MSIYSSTTINRDWVKNSLSKTTEKEKEKFPTKSTKFTSKRKSE